MVYYALCNFNDEKVCIHISKHVRVLHMVTVATRFNQAFLETFVGDPHKPAIGIRVAHPNMSFKTAILKFRKTFESRVLTSK